MKCYIYRSGHRDDMYLYLRDRDDFSVVPAKLMACFVNPVFVFDLELSQTRKLARADVRSVMDALAEKGFYLQMPVPNQALG